MSKKFKIQNFYEKEEVQQFDTHSHNPNFEHHGIKVPFRMVVLGASGSGKTNVVTNLLNFMSGTFNNIYLFTRCADEPLYNYIRHKLRGNNFYVHEGIESLNKIKLNKYFSEKEGQVLIIFDDLVLEKDQSQIEELFIRGRKLAKGISLCYLSQSFYNIPKMVRLQMTHLILRRVPSSRDLSSVIKNLSMGMTKEELQELYETYVGESITDFITVNLTTTPDKAFKINFNDGIIDVGHMSLRQGQRTKKSIG